MKLAIVRQRYDAFGGAERFIASAAPELDRAGVKLTVISREWTVNSGSGRWIYCNPFYLGRIWRDRGFARAACRQIANEDFDLVQAHERIACCDIFRAGDGVHAHWLELRAAVLNGPRRWWQRFSPFHRHLLAAEKALFASKRLRAVICNSRMVKNEIKQRFGLPDARLHVIYNGVDLVRFIPSVKANRSERLASIGVPQNAKIVLFVGSGFERKGVPALLDAFARLQRDQIFLLIVGKDRRENKYRERARKLGIETRVRWLGPQPDVQQWYGCADVFVLPTLYDPFPNAALEAMACGVPIVVSSQCGAAEIVRDGWNGFIVTNPWQVDSLVEKIDAVLDSAVPLDVNARKTAETFDMRSMARQLAELYRSLLDGRSNKDRTLPQA